MQGTTTLRVDISLKFIQDYLTLLSFWIYPQMPNSKIQHQVTCFTHTTEKSTIYI